MLLSSGMASPVAGITNDSTFQSLKLSLQAAEMRHQAISSNIANINTPNYKRVDLAPSFQAEFSRALDQLRVDSAPATTPTATLGEDPTSVVSRFDGNNVNFDREMVEMVKNQSQHEFAARMLSQKYGAIRMAITGKAS